MVRVRDKERGGEGRRMGGLDIRSRGRERKRVCTCPYGEIARGKQEEERSQQGRTEERRGDERKRVCTCPYGEIARGREEGERS